MELFKENSPDTNIDEKEIDNCYCYIFKSMARNKFQPTPAEAIFLRSTIRNILRMDEEIKNDSQNTERYSEEYIKDIYGETLERFFWHFYGVNLGDYYHGISASDKESWVKATQKLYEYIKRQRSEQELL